MIPGTVSKLSISTVVSADKIAPKTDVVHVLVGAVTTINVISSPIGDNFSAMLILIPNASLTLGGGPGTNISTTVTVVASRAVFLIYSSRGKVWYVNSGV